MLPALNVSLPYLSPFGFFSMEPLFLRVAHAGPDPHDFILFPTLKSGSLKFYVKPSPHHPPPATGLLQSLMTDSTTYGDARSCQRDHPGLLQSLMTESLSYNLARAEAPRATSVPPSQALHM